MPSKGFKMPFLRKLLLPALAVFVLAAGSASASDPSSFIFRYKTGLISEAGTTEPPATCQIGESGLPDCNGHCDAGDEAGSVDCPTTEPVDTTDDGICDPGEENTRDCRIITVDGVPNWDQYYTGGTLALTATEGSRDVGSSNLIYQCFKATGGNGNYQFWLNRDVAGDTHWMEAIDIVTKDNLASPVAGSVYSYGYLAPAFNSGVNRLTVDHVGDVCIRALVKPDQVPAADAFADLWVDDYPTSAVIGGTVNTAFFNNTESWASVAVKLKPNCVNAGCAVVNYPPANPGPSGFSLEPDVAVTQKVSATKAHHVYNMQDAWNGADMATGPVFIAKGGQFPYTIHANIGEGQWLARPGNDGECEISALTNIFALAHGDASPGDVNKNFTGNLSVTEAGGEEKHYAITFAYQAVQANYFDGGSTMNITIPDCNGEYGPDYVPPTPITEVTIDPYPYNPTQPGSAPAPLNLTMTTRKETGGMFYQCFNATGGYGHYNFWLGFFTSGDDPDATWPEGMDIVTPNNLESPLSDVGEFPVPVNSGSIWYYTSTSQGEICARIQPKSDGSGNRAPLGLLMGVQDYQDPNPSFGPPPATNPSPNGEAQRYFTVTPGARTGGDPGNGDGVCQVGETGSDCNGVCETGESGSVDCSGGTAPVNDGDFVCEPGESGTDCDGTCSPTEETSIDCPIPAEFEPAEIVGFGSTGAISGGAAADPSKSVFDITKSAGYLELAPYAPLFSGGYFGYQCFYVSNGSWANWDHVLTVDEIDGDFPWLTNLDLVYKSDLYYGTVAPFTTISDHTGRRLPEGLVGTTTQTNVCARWIVQRPAAADRKSVTLRLTSYNVDGNTLDGSVDYVPRGTVMELTPRP